MKFFKKVLHVFVLLRCFFSEESFQCWLSVNFIFNAQVLFLKNLSLALGETYQVKWDMKPADYDRFDCHPEEGADEAKCKARGCIWEVGNYFNV